MSMEQGASVVRPVIGIACAIATAVLPATAAACTLCHSPDALSVRERLFDGDIWFNMSAILLPIVALALIVLLVACDFGAAGDRG